jgi:hypothetical protein
MQIMTNKKLLLSTIVAITIVASIGFGQGPFQQVTSAFAWTPAPLCGPVTAPISGGSQVSSYYVSQTYTGQCAVDKASQESKNLCNVVNGIGASGHCEMVTKGYQVTPNGPATLPIEEWFHFNGVSLAPGQFLDMVDTTPFFTTKGHVAMVIPCNSHGDPQVKLFEGIVDGGLNTLEPITPQYLQHLSDPTNGICVYHFDIGATTNNPDGVTDFAVVNISNQQINFGERNTSTFSLAEGFLNKMS